VTFPTALKTEITAKGDIRVYSEVVRELFISDVSGRAQSPEPGPARPSKARPEAGLGSGFQWARAWLKVRKAQSPGLKPGPHNQLRKQF
jgi:hypothetical protein